MSLFSSMMGDFEDDMFMGNPINMMNMQMRSMNRMMNSLMPDPFNMLTPFDNSFQQNALVERNNGPPAMGGFFGFPMPNMNRLLSADIGGNGGTSFCSSSVISMSSGPDGRPQIYQATTSSKTGPGGIRETRKTVQDSMTGVKKMAIGHHIGERAHIIEKEQDLRSGQLEERQEFINLDEEQAEDFDREFTNKAQMGAGSRRREILAIEDVPDEDDEVQTDRRHRRRLPGLPPATNSPSYSKGIHHHPYKNAAAARRQLHQRKHAAAANNHNIEFLQLQQQQQKQKQQQTQIQEVDDDDDDEEEEETEDEPQVIVEEPDDDDDDDEDEDEDEDKEADVIPTKNLSKQ